MTVDEAIDTVNESHQLAQTIYDLLRRIATPDTASVALGLVAGTTLSSLAIEEGVDMDEMLADWLTAVKMQYKEVQEFQKRSNN